MREMGVHVALNTQEEIKKVWGSHIPVTKAYMAAFKPSSVVECGCGDFSTPILSATDKHVIIEHDAEWAKKVSAPKAEFFVDQVTENTRREAGYREVDRIQGLYNGYKDRLGNFDLLFVDTVTCARVVAANTLGPKAKAIIIHDITESGYAHYNWDLLRLEEFPFKFTFKPRGSVREHGYEWTLLAMREVPHVITWALFLASVENFSEELWGKGSKWDWEIKS